MVNVFPLTSGTVRIQHRAFSQLVTERFTRLSLHPEDRAGDWQHNCAHTTVLISDLGPSVCYLVENSRTPRRLPGGVI